jgi:hypothetical protein
LKRGLSKEETEFVETLIRWPTFTKEQRVKKYSENCCHELNLFLKMKDPEYFESVVRPFLANKIEKTFVDYWLLDLDADMKTFEPIHSKK